MFRKLEKRILIEYEVETMSDLHIGGSSVTAPGEVDIPVIKNADGYPIIPGSSLKGVLRSEIEKLLNAKIESEDIVTSRAAELFGGTIAEKNKEFAASIRIRDATANSKRTIIRDHVVIDIKTRKQNNKFDMEAVPKGTIFTGEMYIENPGLGEGADYGKLGALISTIRFFNATTRSLGGATSRGYGEVEIRIKRIREFTPEDYLDGNVEGRELSVPEEEIIGQWKDYVENISG